MINFWTDEELGTIEQNYLKIPMKKLQLLLPNRSREAIYTAVAKLRRNKIGNYNATVFIAPRKFWADDEVHKLREMYPTATKSELQAALHRNFPTIIHKAQELGLYREVRRFRLLGKRVGPLVVKSWSHSDSIAMFWHCECDCGKVYTKSSRELRSDKTHLLCDCIPKPDKFIRRASDDEILVTLHLNSSRDRAKEKNMEFSLTREEFSLLMHGNCEYCGVEPKLHSNIYATSKTNKRIVTGYRNGLDRVDNTKGYTVDNSVACCWTCNTAKSSMTTAEWESYLKRLIDFQTKKGL